MKKTPPMVSLLLFYFITSQIAFAQAVVVSEYFNASSVADEWTELVIVGDNVSLAGYKLRDNVGTDGVPDEWQGGVEFADSQLWRNLRIGTVIVINHRGNGAADVNKTDGYIEVDADNPDYFIRRCWGCDLSFDWTTKALVIAQSAEIIQILDDNDNNVHALGHMAASSGDFPGITGLKSSYNGAISGNTSVMIAPGMTLSQYNAGFDITNYRTFASGQLVTKGKPNKRDASDNRNGEFWKTLRQPAWSNPDLQASVVPDGIKLDWNRLTIPNPDDNFHGYTILRSLSAEIISNPPIEDGLKYEPGRQLNSWTVVANIHSGNKLTYTDTASLECSAEQTYHIYGYRYGSDIARNNEAPLGRAYNEQNYGETSIINDGGSDSVEIYVGDGRMWYCEGDTVIIYSKIKDDSYYYSWFRGNAFVGDSQDSIKVKKMGNKSVYWLQMVAKDSSHVLWSNKLEITFLNKPDVKLFNDDGQEVWYDHKIRLCTGEEYELSATAQNSNRINWHRNGNLLIPDTSSITVKESGTYYASASLNEECFDTTKKLTIIFQDFDFTVEDDNGVEPDTLRFNLYGNNNSNERGLVIKNNSDDTLFLSQHDVTIGPGGFFSIVLPYLPFKILPHDSLALRIRYENHQPGKISGTLIFDVPCGNTREIVLKGEKLISDISLSDTLIDFDGQINCSTKSSQRELSIKTYGDKQFTFFEPSISPPFFIISPSFNPPLELAAGEELKITLGFNSSIVETYIRNLEIPFQKDGTNSSIKVILKGRIFDTRFKFKPDSVNFRAILDCESKIDTNVFVYNIGDSALIFNSPGNIQNITFRNSFPLNILSGDSAELIFTYTPQGTGEAFGIEFTANPCLQTEPYLYITGSKNGNSIIPEAEIVEFGILADCDFPGEVPKQQFLAVTGNHKEYPSIDSIGILGNFSTDLQVGRILDQDTNYYSVSLLPGPSGVYEGELAIKYAPCGIVEVINLHGVRAEPLLDINPSVDFGMNLWTADTTVNCIITNNGAIPITINSVSGLAPPFSLNQSVHSLPLRIAPQQSGTLQFDYVRNTISNDTLDITLNIEPCGKTEQVALLGNVYEGDGGSLALNLPDKLSGLPGEIITMPISLVENQPLILSEANVSSVNFKLTFNPWVLAADEVYFGSDFDSGIVSGLQFSEDPIGELNINFEVNNPLSLSAGNWINVDFLCLVGNSASTAIYAEGVVGSESPIAVLTDSSFFELNDSLRSVVGGSAGMSVSVLQSDEIRIDYSVVASDPVSISMYNSLGVRVREVFNGTAKPGSHSITATIRDLPVGAYFLLMHTGILKRFGKFLIIR